MSQKKFVSSGHFAKIYTLLVIDRNLWDYLKKTVKYQNFPTFSYSKTATRTTRKTCAVSCKTIYFYLCRIHMPLLLNKFII